MEQAACTGIKPEAPADRWVGRTEPPLFMFELLRTRALGPVELKPSQVPKVLALVAPVGYGKTVQMATRLADLRRTGRQCLWFALDDRDTTIDSLIGVFESLLNGQEPSLHPTQALFRGLATDESRIDALVASVNAYPLPITLFIDNLNCCADEALGALLDRLVFDTLPSVQLVLSSTRELPLDISRAQLQGLIRLVGAVELSLRVDQVGKMLGTELCRAIGHRGVETVAKVTEGWPAAVRMAQIILSSADKPQAELKLLSGSDTAFAHLLNRQVLTGLPPAVRDFLLCIAQLRTFCVELCSHITGSPHAKAHLAYLLDRNVFVIPLDRNRNWYRLHGLFRDFVLHEAENVLGDARRREVLLNAANWCEQHSYWREAIDYALTSGSTATTLRILERTAPMFVRDKAQVAQYIQWLEVLHAQGHRAGPEAEYWFAWALAFRRSYDYARQQIAMLADRIQVENQANLGSQPRDLHRRIAMLRTSIDSLGDHREEAHRGASQWLASAIVGIDDPFNLAAAHCIETNYLTNAHRFVLARQAIQSAHETAFQANSVHVEGWVSAYTALISIYEGDYAGAYPKLIEALAKARAVLGEDAGICGTMAMVAAKCAAEMGLDEEAWRLFNDGARSSRTHGFLEATACGLDAAILLWNGAPDDRISIPQLREIASAYPPRLSLMLSCSLIERLTTLGRTDEALIEADRVGLQLGAASPQATAGAAAFPHLDMLIESARISLLVALGRFKQAESLIDEAQRHAKAAYCAASQVTLALTLAEIATRSARPTDAARYISRAVSLAAPRNIVRPFQDKAASLAVAVADTKVGTWGFATLDERRFFVDRCRNLVFADQSLIEHLTSVQDDQLHAVSALTSRELELLRYVDAGLSNQQIADRSGVSVTTVKWHFQNIFSKLEVRSRSAALARARILNLLSK
jgi:LuxR family maltose regulon positive regulatory protein